jgi:hypothetical protein
VNVYPFIEAEKRCRRNVKRACELLKVSRAAFYEHLSGPSGRDKDDADLAAKIESVHEESKGRYGAPRVHAELRRRGQRHGRKRVARLMRQAGLTGLAAKRWKKTTIADPAAAARADRIRRDFSADASRLNSRWCGDITYIRTWEGWLFLATVIDIASRRVVGYAMAGHLRTGLISAALGNAVAARDPDPGVIFHSDRGCQGVHRLNPPSTRPLTSPALRRTTRWCCPWAGPASAGTTPSPKASSAPSKASSSTCRPGRPGPVPAGRSSSTSPGTTAPGCTAPSDTEAPPNTRPPQRRTSGT